MALLLTNFYLAIMALLHRTTAVGSGEDIYATFYPTDSFNPHLHIYQFDFVSLHKVDFKIECSNSEFCLRNLQEFRFFGISPYFKHRILLKLSLKGYCVGWKFFDEKSKPTTKVPIDKLASHTFSLEMNPNLVVGDMPVTFEHIRSIEFRHLVLRNEEPVDDVAQGFLVAEMPYFAYANIYYRQHEDFDMACYDKPPVFFVANLSSCNPQFFGTIYAINNITLLVEGFDVAIDQANQYRDNLRFAAFTKGPDSKNHFLLDERDITVTYGGRNATTKMFLASNLELDDIEGLTLISDMKSLCRIPIPEDIKRKVSTRFYYRQSVFYTVEQSYQLNYCKKLYYVPGSKPVFTNGYIVDSIAEFQCYNEFYLYPANLSLVCSQISYDPEWDKPNIEEAECISPEITCSERECLNGGHCDNKKCKCPDYALGKFCETLINPCKPNPCNGNYCRPNYAEKTYECICSVEARDIVDKNCLPSQKLVEKCGPKSTGISTFAHNYQCICLPEYEALQEEMCEKPMVCRGISFGFGKVKSDKISFSANEHVQIECNEGFKLDVPYVTCHNGMLWPNSCEVDYNELKKKEFEKLEEKSETMIVEKTRKKDSSSKKENASQIIMIFGLLACTSVLCLICFRIQKSMRRRDHMRV